MSIMQGVHMSAINQFHYASKERAIDITAMSEGGWGMLHVVEPWLYGPDVTVVSDIGTVAELKFGAGSSLPGSNIDSDTCCLHLQEGLSDAAVAHGYADMFQERM